MWLRCAGCDKNQISILNKPVVSGLQLFYETTPYNSRTIHVRGCEMSASHIVSFSSCLFVDTNHYPFFFFLEKNKTCSRFKICMESREQVMCI